MDYGPIMSYLIPSISPIQPIGNCINSLAGLMIHVSWGYDPTSLRYGMSQWWWRLRERETSSIPLDLDCCDKIGSSQAKHSRAQMLTIAGSVCMTCRWSLQGPKTFGCVSKWGINMYKSPNDPNGIWIRKKSSGIGASKNSDTHIITYSWPWSPLCSHPVPAEQYGRICPDVGSGNG
jgi:hypothetical protein